MKTVEFVRDTASEIRKHNIKAAIHVPWNNFIEMVLEQRTRYHCDDKFIKKANETVLLTTSYYSDMLKLPIGPPGIIMISGARDSSTSPGYVRAPESKYINLVPKKIDNEHILNNVVAHETAHYTRGQLGVMMITSHYKLPKRILYKSIEEAAAVCGQFAYILDRGEGFLSKIETTREGRLVLSLKDSYNSIDNAFRMYGAIHKDMEESGLVNSDHLSVFLTESLKSEIDIYKIGAGISTLLLINKGKLDSTLNFLLSYSYSEVTAKILEIVEQDRNKILMEKLKELKRMEEDDLKKMRQIGISRAKALTRNFEEIING